MVKNGAMSGNVSFQMEWRSAGGATPVFIRMRSQESFSKILPERLELPQDKRGIIPICNECNKHVGDLYHVCPRDPSKTLGQNSFFEKLSCEAHPDKNRSGAAQRCRHSLKQNASARGPVFYHPHRTVGIWGCALTWTMSSRAPPYGAGRGIHRKVPAKEDIIHAISPSGAGDVECRALGGLPQLQAADADFHSPWRGARTWKIILNIWTPKGIYHRQLLKETMP